MASILFVDDDDLFRQAVAKVLRAAGYTVREASDGYETLHVFREVQPALVITDLFMPRCDGLQCITSLRAIDPDIPILAISGGGGPGGLDCLFMALKLGASHTLAKPFQRDELLAAVTEALMPASRHDSRSPLVPPRSTPLPIK